MHETGATGNSAAAGEMRPRTVSAGDQRLRAIEEFHRPGLQRILRSNDGEAAFVDECLQYARPVAQRTGRHTHVCPHRVLREAPRGDVVTGVEDAEIPAETDGAEG